MSYTNINIKQIIWLAGFLEGEGCFAYYCSPGIRVGGTDEDIIMKVAKILKRHVRGGYKYKINKKPVFYTEIWANNAVAWMLTLYSLMGKRRKQKIREIIARWINAPTKAHKLGKRRKAICHPSRKHYAKGMCHACYLKKRRKRGLVG